MGRLGTRLVVTGEDLHHTSSPPHTPSCYDNYFTETQSWSHDRTRRGSKIQGQWKPKVQYRIPLASPGIPFCHKPETQPKRYTIDLPLHNPSYNQRAATPELASAEEPAEEEGHCLPEVRVSKDRCTWKFGLGGGGTNTHYFSRGHEARPEKEPSWRDTDEWVPIDGTDEAHRMRPIGLSNKGFNATINMIAGDRYGRTESPAQLIKKQKGFAWLGPPRKLVDSNGQLWMKPEPYAPVMQRSSIPKSCPLPLPIAPHKIPRSQYKGHVESGTMIPVRERLGVLERSTSVSTFVGLSYPRNMEFFKVSQRQPEISIPIVGGIQ